MVVVMKPGTRKEEIEALARSFEQQGLNVGITNGVGCTILGLVGDTTAVDMDEISILPNVERIMRVRLRRIYAPFAISAGRAQLSGRAPRNVRRFDNARALLPQSWRSHTKVEELPGARAR